MGPHGTWVSGSACKQHIKCKRSFITLQATQKNCIKYKVKNQKESQEVLVEKKIWFH